MSETILEKSEGRVSYHDSVEMRNFLLKNIMGAGTYSHHAYEAFRTLKATAEGKTPFKITNVDGSHVSLAMKSLRLGIATIYSSQIGLEMVQDILFGTPKPHEVNMDLGIMDPELCNFKM